MLNIDLNGLMSGFGKLATNVRSAVTGKIDPEAEAQISLEMSKLENSISLAQSEINKTEAASPNILVAGWRPFIGWVCGISIFQELVIKPWVMVFGITYPIMDMNSVIMLLSSLLGFTVMRTYEKSNGLNSMH